MRFLQTEAAECGLVSLAYVLAKNGHHLDMADLRRRFPVSSRGLTLRNLTEISAELDMQARAIRCELDELSQLKLPVILHWNFNHFVVLEKVTHSYVVVHDPAKGRLKLKVAELGHRFTGIALELTPTPQFKRRTEKSPLSIMSWVRINRDLYSGFGQVLVLSALLQVYIVASPFYMQLAIDQGALKGDKDLLLTLAIGFGLFGLFNIGAGYLRNLAMQQIASDMGWEMGLRLFRHMVRLPLGWFQRRRLADTISRFDALNPIRDLISGALISSIIDGALALTTLLMMFLFAWQLAVFVCLATVLYVVVRLLSLPTSLRLSGEALTAHIQENSKRIETIKAIQTIKVMSAELTQEGQWANKYAESIRRTLTGANFNMTVATVHQAFEIVISTAIIYAGAMSIIEAKMTVGILYAFMAYKGQFSSAVGNIVEQVIQWKLSDIYSYRLAEIVLSQKEAGVDVADLKMPAIQGNIEVENLSFRYAPYEPFVFKNLNIKINAGEFIAVVGPSGVGKSSLMKVLCGLYPAHGGEVRFDGRPISSWTPKAIRQNLGVVMQDDELLSGSIAENVSFFDENINMERMWSALEAANLTSEVLAMPMKAETLVGDMGGALSGGQKQRIIIARALYKQPKILIMDEATSHLDRDNEAKINGHLRKLAITRIVIAHRQETIQAADRIYDLHVGKFVAASGVEAASL